MSGSIVLRGGTVLTVDGAHRVLPGEDVLVTGERDRRHRAGSRRPGGHRGDRRHRRHRHAGHDRHPPAPVADRHARLRRRLDAHAVLRLVLPRMGQGVPPRGHPRGQPARRVGSPRSGRHDHRRLVPRPADDPARRRRGRRARSRPRPVRAGLRQHPGRPGELDGHARVPRLRLPPHRRRPRLPARLRRHRRPGVPGEAGVRGGARAGRAGDHPRRVSGARPATTASA